ncbi:MAG: hypothetical protein IJK90_09990 [Bacteroidales bacterium]|nr:hypothetical protein [Bacteroidales bacterium]
MAQYKVLLKYQDTNGHNFKVIGDVPDRIRVNEVEVNLHEGPQQIGHLIDAVDTYKSDMYRITVRSTQITEWLRNNARPGDLFSATLEVTNNGEKHEYKDIKKL